MKHLSIDIETYSSIDIKKSGLYRYAQSEDFGEVKIIDLAQGESIPVYLLSALKDETVIKHAFTFNK